MIIYCDKVLTTNYKIGVEKQIQNFKFPKGCFAGFFLFSWNMPFYFQLIIVVNCCYCRLWGFRSDFVLGSCTTTWGKACYSMHILSPEVLTVTFIFHLWTGDNQTNWKSFCLWNSVFCPPTNRMKEYWLLANHSTHCLSNSVWYNISLWMIPSFLRLKLS